MLHGPPTHAILLVQFGRLEIARNEENEILHVQFGKIEIARKEGNGREIETYTLFSRTETARIEKK